MPFHFFPLYFQIIDWKLLSIPLHFLIFKQHNDTFILFHPTPLYTISFHTTHCEISKYSFIRNCFNFAPVVKWQWVFFFISFYFEFTFNYIYKYQQGYGLVVSNLHFQKKGYGFNSWRRQLLCGSLSRENTQIYKYLKDQKKYIYKSSQKSKPSRLSTRKVVLEYYFP